MLLSLLLPKDIIEKLYPRKKSSTEDKYILCFFIRRMSLPFSYYILNPLNISPNFISLLSLISGLAGSLLFIGQNYLLGSIMIIIWGLFDCCDGEVARLSGKNSSLGLILESVNSNLQYILWLPSLAMGLCLGGEIDTWLAMLSAFACGSYNLARSFFSTYPESFLGKPSGSLKKFIACQFKNQWELREQNSFPAFIFYFWRNILTQQGVFELGVLILSLPFLPEHKHLPVFVLFYTWAYLIFSFSFIFGLCIASLVPQKVKK